MPSRHEGLSMLSIEASMAKLPVIANDCMGLRDTLPDDWPLKVTDNDIDQYLRLFNEVLPTADRESLGEKAHAFATENFSIEKMQKGYEEFYAKKNIT